MTDRRTMGAYRYVAELPYATTPRDLWALALLRAHQLGATTIALRPRAAWHACAGGGFDLAGYTLPERDLRGLVRLCGRLGLAVVLDLADAPAPAWSAVLAELQAPAGPIAAIWCGAQGAGELAAAGWRVPALPPAPTLGLGLGAGHPLLRADGSPRPAFWRARLPHMLLGASDEASPTAPADLLLLDDLDGPAHPALAVLAERLRRAGIAFHQLSPADCSPMRVARYTLAIAPLALAEHPLAAALAPLSNVALIGAPADNLPERFRYKPRLAPDCSAEQIAETIEGLGGRPRYAWADTPAVALELQYSTRLIYLGVQNRQPGAYHGMLTYRALDGAVLHLQLGIGGGQRGMVLLHDDELLGAAIDGEASEGGWLTRGLHTSMMFNNGAGALADWGGALIATAPQSGRFQVRRPAGWPGMAAYRLLLNGALLPATMQTDADHLTLPYVAEDAQGATDCYLLAPVRDPLPVQVRAYLGGLLRARALLLAQFAEQAAADERPAAPLERIAAYAEAWAAADAPVRALIAALESPAPAEAGASAQRLAELARELLT